MGKRLQDDTAQLGQSGRGAGRHRQQPVGPIHQWFFLYKKFLKSSLSVENIAGKGGQIWKILWR
jgi:hypothetical protein